MRKKDIPVIVVVVLVSAILSLLVSSHLFASPKNRQQKVDKVQDITSSFSSPDTRYFNSNANDPTQQINTGQNANANPFNSSSQ